MTTADEKNEHKQIFTELEDLYKRTFVVVENKRKEKHPESFLYGWTWWSLPPKMWRIAKILGFKNDEFNHEWILHNTISGYGDYNSSMAAQNYALKILREKYPDNVLLHNIFSRGRLD